MKPFFDALRQPEYVHVLLNPLPVYGLALSALAALAVAAIGLPLRWPHLRLPLATLTWISALAVLGLGVWIAYAGGKVRHREFRNEPPPVLTARNNGAVTL